MYIHLQFWWVLPISNGLSVPTQKHGLLFHLSRLLLWRITRFGPNTFQNIIYLTVYISDFSYFFLKEQKEIVHHVNINLSGQVGLWVLWLPLSSSLPFSAFTISCFILFYHMSVITFLVRSSGAIFCLHLPRWDNKTKSLDDRPEVTLNYSFWQGDSTSLLPPNVGFF